MFTHRYESTLAGIPRWVLRVKALHHNQLPNKTYETQAHLSKESTISSQTRATIGELYTITPTLTQIISAACVCSGVRLVRGLNGESKGRTHVYYFEIEQ